MPRIHDILAVHGVGEQRRGDTLTRFAEQFYKGVRWLVQEAGQDPNQVEMSGRYQDNRLQVRYGDEIFRLWEISWERSFHVPSADRVLDWLGLWSSQYLNRAFRQAQGKEARQYGRGPWPRTLWVLALLLDLTLFVPLLAALLWMWAAAQQVHQQKVHADQADHRTVVRHRLATGVALTLSTPLLVGLHTLARIGRLAAGLPLIGRLANRMAQNLEDLVIGSLGDILLYIFDPIQSAFIRGDLEQAVAEAYALAQEEEREPLIHIIGHSMGSVIAYEVVSRSLDPQLRKGVKTLCTMGTVLDMIRYVLGGEGLVLKERVRFSADIPREKQGDTHPRWLNLFARNDPAAGFSPLLEFGGDPTNLPVCSTPKGHSTYWGDMRGVYRPFLNRVAQGNPVFDKPYSPPPLECQATILKDIGRELTKLLVLVGVIVGAAWLGAWRFDVGLTEVGGELDRLVTGAALPWPLDWLALGLVWLSKSAMNLVFSLPHWYLKWLLWIGVALAVCLILAIPLLIVTLLRRLEANRLVPLDADANLNHWVGALDKIGPVYELTLRKQGIWTVHQFLVAVARSGGRTQLARALDVSEAWVSERARQANLMRLRELGPQWAALLIAIGVDSLATLSQQERSTLLEHIVPHLKAFGLSRPPAGEQLSRWIEQAKGLEDVV